MTDETKKESTSHTTPEFAEAAERTEPGEAIFRSADDGAELVVQPMATRHHTLKLIVSNVKHDRYTPVTTHHVILTHDDTERLITALSAHRDAARERHNASREITEALATLREWLVAAHIDIGNNPFRIALVTYTPEGEPRLPAEAQQLVDTQLQKQASEVIHPHTDYYVTGDVADALMVFNVPIPTVTAPSPNVDDHHIGHPRHADVTTHAPREGEHTK